MIRFLGLILPPFHPLKYKIINWWYGEQTNEGAWKSKKSNKITPSNFYTLYVKAVIYKKIKTKIETLKKYFRKI